MNEPNTINVQCFSKMLIHAATGRSIEEGHLSLREQEKQRNDLKKRLLQSQCSNDEHPPPKGVA